MHIHCNSKLHIEEIRDVDDFFVEFAGFKVLA
jgi:hypothetical protein